MKAISILNDVLGPVMRGPSSSHTAAPFYIGAMARALLGDEPAEAAFTFDPRGSWAEVRKEMAGRYPKHHWPVDPANDRPRRPGER